MSLSPAATRARRPRRAVWLLLAAVCAVLAGCGADPHLDGPRSRTGEIGGDAVRVDLPFNGQARGVAVWFHGKGGDANSRMNTPWLNALRADGWAVASGDLGGDSWGSPAAVQAADQLADWASAQAGAPVRMLLAGSMGGLASLNALTQGVIAAPCWYGTMPVVDLGKVAHVPDAQEQVADVYDGPVPASSNPAANLDRLPDGLRMRVLSSPADEQVLASEHAALLASRPGVSSRTVSGLHNDPSHFDEPDLLAFAAGCRG